MDAARVPVLAGDSRSHGNDRCGRCVNRCTCRSADFLDHTGAVFGIETAADDGDGLEASASTGAANADCADVVCSIGRETVSLSNPECHCVTLLKLSCEKVRKTGIHGSP